MSEVGDSATCVTAGKRAVPGDAAQYRQAHVQGHRFADDYRHWVGRKSAAEHDPGDRRIGPARRLHAKDAIAIEGARQCPVGQVAAHGLCLATEVAADEGGRLHEMAVYDGGRF